ncbi:molybdenum cofactor guanylyltransferase [Desulforamulus reducens MI-1]|uniref:Probable molybdenum cofactor guanylyltransferase n=1 Tax=Desulforamulus reducens (strain ATCC BAA-1160 / DSM 100696 / MI-1) TaxID=349161 RepID=A4J3J3_DESRM|nr:molybdenum cofactor guanylyltransferase [Desulforamulus reducens]ABO49646.1 molybdenum cofactor guanylyltransferase [Desulforamulus reducens MI-1]
MDKKCPYSAVILAGGSSSRMKTNKALLEFHGRSIIQTIIDKLQLFFQQIIIISNQPDQYSHFNLPIYCDIILNRGPLSGIHSGLKNITTNGAFFVACDMPFVNPQLAQELTSNLSYYQAVVPRQGEYLQPLYAAYRKDCIQAVEQALQIERPRIKSFYDLVQVNYFDIYKRPQYNWDKIFFNVNTPEEYQIAQKL